MTDEGHRIALQRKSRGLSIAVGLKGTKLWELTLRKFRVSRKDCCKAMPIEMAQKPAPKVTFLTGSTYEGEWTELGMSGKGTYEFPITKPGPRLVYTGEFDDGMFDGTGTLKYPDGNIIDGKWSNGTLQDKKLSFSDGLEYKEKNWRYCCYPDRRYTVEYNEGVPAAGDSYITSDRVPRPIPKGYYDIGDGLYDPITKNIVRYDDRTYVLRACHKRESKWIEENCRISDESCEPLGPCPFLYDEWMAPALEAEYPPPPAARTRQYLDDVKEIEEWLKRNARRDSTPFARRSGLFTFRKATGAGDHAFYRPTYLRSSASSITSTGRGRLTFEVSNRTSQGPIAERHKSMFRTGRHSTKHGDHDRPKTFTDDLISAKKEVEKSSENLPPAKPYFAKRRETVDNKGPVAMGHRINW